MSEEGLGAHVGGAGQKNVIENFLTSVERCIRSARLYTYESGKNTLETVYDNVYGLLQKSFESNEDDILDISIKPYQMIQNRKVVYENKDKKNSLAFSLHDCGIRRIRFNQAMTREEMVKVIEIFATDFNRTEMMDEDIHTLLFEWNPENFSAPCADIVAELHANKPEIKAVMEEYRREKKKRIVEPDATEPRRNRSEDLKVLEEFRLNSSQFSHSHEDISKIVQSLGVQTDGEAKEKETLERLALMGFHFLVQESEVEQIEVGRNLLSQVAIMMLEGSQIRLFYAITQKLYQLQSDLPERRGEYQKVLDAMFDAKHEDLFRRLLSSQTHQKEAASLLLKAPPSAVRLIVLLLDATPWMPRSFGDFVLRNLPAHSEWLISAVQKDPASEAWEPLLNIMSKRPNQHFSSFLTALLESAKDTLRLKVLKQCAQIGTPETLAVLKKMLESDEYEERKQAYDLISLARNRNALVIMKEHLQSRGFELSDDSEKIFVYSTIINIGGEASFAWFEHEWMKPATGFFKSKHLNERRTLLVKSAARASPGFLEQIEKKTGFRDLSPELMALIKRARAVKTDAGI